MSAPEFDVDRRRVRQSFSSAATSYDAAAALQNEVADRLLGRLDYIRLQPETILDLGAGTGYCSDALLKRYPKSRLLAMDFAEGMLDVARKRGRLFRRPVPVCADAGALPLKDNSVDLVFSSLMLQWCHPVENYLREFHRVLAQGGLLMFSTFGTDTLNELKQAWAKVDQGEHVHGFLDMHDIGDAMVRAGLAEPVVDAENIVLTYSDVLGLLRDLKAIGANYAGSGRARGMFGRKTLARLGQAYESFRNAEGKLPATYEVVYGHAWGAVVEASQAPERFIPVKKVDN